MILHFLLLYPRLLLLPSYYYYYSHDECVPRCTDRLEDRSVSRMVTRYRRSLRVPTVSFYKSWLPVCVDRIVTHGWVTILMSDTTASHSVRVMK